LKDKEGSGDLKIKVLIADDHPVVRVGVTSMLTSNNDMVVAGEAANVEETLQGLSTLEPDVTVLDIAMAGTSGIESVRRVREAAPDAKIVVYTAYTQLEVAIQALDLGVQGYLLKDSPHPGLAMAIRIVHEGGTFIDPNISRELVGRYKNQDRIGMPFKLTARERQVLRLVAEGTSNRGIADKLYISERTVKFHVSSILGKLGAQNRTEAVRIATDDELLGGDNHTPPNWH
jgi:DNA-binding NarL/FixJ family response regulator